MGFCKYGNQKMVGRGIYYICSSTNLPCKFARWCSSEQVYKPNANFNSCAIKINEQKKEEEAEEAKKIKKRNKKAKKIETELVENINEEDIGVS